MFLPPSKFSMYYYFQSLTIIKYKHFYLNFCFVHLAFLHPSFHPSYLYFLLTSYSLQFHCCVNEFWGSSQYILWPPDLFYLFSTHLFILLSSRLLSAKLTIMSPEETSSQWKQDSPCKNSYQGFAERLLCAVHSDRLWLVMILKNYMELSQCCGINNTKIYKIISKHYVM